MLAFISVAAFFVQLAITAALTYGIMLLTKPKEQEMIDDSKPSPSVRGSICGMLIGKRIISPKIGFVGGEYRKRSKAFNKQKVFYSKAIHFLSVGQGSILYRILEDGKDLFTTPLDSVNDPSGNTFYFCDEGHSGFRIYWGERTQPINTSLAAITGLSSRYGDTMMVMWNHKRLSTQNYWPMLKYEVLSKLQFTTLFGTDVEVSNTAGAISVTMTLSLREFVTFDSDVSIDIAETRIWRPVFHTTSTSAADIEEGAYLRITKAGEDFLSIVQSSRYDSGNSRYEILTVTDPPDSFLDASYTVSIFDEENVGYNPAAIIYQLLFYPYPYGLNYDTSDYDLNDLEDIMDYYKEGGTMPFPASLWLTDNKSIKDGLNMIYQDCGIWQALDQETGKYRFIHVKPTTDTPTTITKAEYEILKDDDGKITTAYSVLDASLRLYRFKDYSRKYQPSTIVLADDGRTRYSEAPNAKIIDIYTATDYVTASLIAARREKEFNARSALSVKLSAPQHLDTQIGSRIILEGVSGVFRIVSKSIDPLEAFIACDLLVDIFANESPTTIKKTPLVAYKSDDFAYPDPAFEVFEANQYFGKDKTIIPLRIRNSNKEIASEWHLSTDDSVYFESLISDNFVAGGILTSSLASDTATTVDSGPTFNIVGFDIDQVKDLSGDEQVWRSGKQLAIINGEVFYLKKIVAVASSDGEYTLTGLIRARHGTLQAAHAIDDIVYIMLASDIEYIQDTTLETGASLYVKSVPYTEGSIVDIDIVDAYNFTYQGGSQRPLPCANLNTSDLTKSYATTEDIDIVWGYRNISGGTGAGLSLADEPYQVPLPEGYFRLEILNGTTVVRTIEPTEAEYTYTNSNLKSDFSGSEPGSFNVQVSSIANGLQSETITVTITKV